MPDENKNTPRSVLENAVKVALQNGWTVESIVQVVNETESASSAGEKPEDVEPAEGTEGTEGGGEETPQS